MTSRSSLGSTRFNKLPHTHTHTHRVHFTTLQERGHEYTFQPTTTTTNLTHSPVIKLLRSELIVPCQKSLDLNPCRMQSGGLLRLSPLPLCLTSWIDLRTFVPPGQIGNKNPFPFRQQEQGWGARPLPHLPSCLEKEHRAR